MALDANRMGAQAPAVVLVLALRAAAMTPDVVAASGEAGCPGGLEFVRQCVRWALDFVML